MDCFPNDSFTGETSPLEKAWYIFFEEECVPRFVLYYENPMAWDREVLGFRLLFYNFIESLWLHELLLHGQR